MTDQQKRLAKKYLTYMFFSNLWFLSAVWLYLYRLFITDQQVGVMDAFAFAIGLIAEVPSGALADKFGRARMVKLGQILAGAGLLIQAGGSSFLPFFVGQSIVMIGAGFISGADEALFFEKLRFDKASTNWRKLVTRGSQVALGAKLLATIIGGLLFTISPRIPWALTGLAFIASAIAIWTVRDDTVTAKFRGFSSEMSEYLGNIRTGFAEFRLPKLAIYVPLIVVVQGLFYATGWGLLRVILLDQFRFSPFLGSVVVASCSLLVVGILAYMHKHAERLSEKRVLVTICLSAAASLLVSLGDIGYWGYFVILILYVGEYTMQPFMSEVLNYHAPEKQRATVLSVASFLKNLPYVLLAPLIGYLSGQQKLQYFLGTYALVIVAVTVVYVAAKKRDARIPINDDL